jgi:hypothetical protein
MRQGSCLKKTEFSTEKIENETDVVPRGFEPRQTESKSVVLPLYYGTKGVQN